MLAQAVVRDEAEEQAQQHCKIDDVHRRGFLGAEEVGYGVAEGGIPAYPPHAAPTTASIPIVIIVVNSLWRWRWLARRRRRRTGDG